MDPEVAVAGLYQQRVQLVVVLHHAGDSNVAQRRNELARLRDRHELRVEADRRAVEQRPGDSEGLRDLAADIGAQHDVEAELLGRFAALRLGRKHVPARHREDSVGKVRAGERAGHHAVRQDAIAGRIDRDLRRIGTVVQLERVLRNARVDVRWNGAEPPDARHGGIGEDKSRQVGRRIRSGVRCLDHERQAWRRIERGLRVVTSAATTTSSGSEAVRRDPSATWIA